MTPEWAQRIEDLRTVKQALFKQPDESLRTAALRAQRRARRFGKVTVRSQVAALILVSDTDKDPWPNIQRAAQLWRRVPR
jgi:hypothetical protein